MKIGDYVRTKDGKIINIQVLQIIKDINCDYVEINYEKILKNNIIKSSTNIIDLIEVGDVIKLEYNGVEYICDVCEYMGKANCLVVYCEDTIIPVKTTDESVELKSIVTHEQFSQMEYRIGD